MALDVNLYPCSGKLILTPSAYTGGTGTNLGLVKEGHLVGFNKSVETYTKQPSGGMAAEAAITAVNAFYRVRLYDWSPSLLGLLWSGMNVSEGVYGLGANYKLGHLVGDNETRKLLIMPVDDAGNVDTDKQLCYFPRALVIGAMPAIWDRVTGHLEGLELMVLALKKSTEALPFRYGRAADLPVFA